MWDRPSKQTLKTLLFIRFRSFGFFILVLLTEEVDCPVKDMNGGPRDADSGRRRSDLLIGTGFDGDSTLRDEER